MTAAIALLDHEDTAMSPPRPSRSLEVLAVRSTRVDGELVSVELEQNIEDPAELSLEIAGVLGFRNFQELRSGGVVFEVLDPAAIRELGQAIIALAHRAERDGWL